MPACRDRTGRAQLGDQFRVSLLARQLTGRIGNRRENPEHQGQTAPHHRHSTSHSEHVTAPAVQHGHQRPAQRVVRSWPGCPAACSTTPSFKRTTPRVLRTMIFNSVGSWCRTGIPPCSVPIGLRLLRRGRGRAPTTRQPLAAASARALISGWPWASEASDPWTMRTKRVAFGQHFRLRLSSASVASRSKMRGSYPSDR